jgi:hypothetical protein
MPLSGNASGVAAAIDRWLFSFNHDLLLPVVTEVVVEAAGP